MRDGLTQKIPAPDKRSGFDTFLSGHRAKLVVVAGTRLGSEFPLDQECLTLGRGPNVDLVFENPTMSRQHAAVEFVDGQFRVRDLGSTNGVQINDTPVTVGDLEHGDRLETGNQSFQLIIEEITTDPESYELPSV